MVSKNLHVGTKLSYPSNIDVWWVCQGERIFVHTSLLFGLKLSLTLFIQRSFNQGMMVLAWYMDQGY